MDGYRAFAGLALPEAYQRELAALCRRLRPLATGPVSWTRPGNWHLTLKFLGEVPLAGPGGLAAVTAALAGLVFSPFVLSGAGGGFFPSQRRPRVAWIGLDRGAAACAALAAAVDTVLSPLGFAPESRPFTPHLTVARFREPGRVGDVEGLARELTAACLPVVPVEALTLWRSLLGPSGPRYEVLATVAAVSGSRCGCIRQAWP
jgi:RNA 2',3'-cyclic 3'-phosphodiesterase